MAYKKYLARSVGSKNKKCVVLYYVIVIIVVDLFSRNSSPRGYIIYVLYCALQLFQRILQVEAVSITRIFYSI